MPAVAAAGHSVGELAAGVIAGVLAADDAMRLVGVRGTAMAKAAAAEPTGMTAVLGGDQDVVLAAIARHGLTPANVNGAGQIVAAGTMKDLAAFAADPPAGARLRPLQVAGAFHTRHMAPAVTALRDAAAGVTVDDPAMTLLSDADGGAVTTGTEWLGRIIAQVAAPVRWDLCMPTMADLGVTAIIELPPAGTLTGLAKRALPGVNNWPNTPDQLDAARDLIEGHVIRRRPTRPRSPAPLPAHRGPHDGNFLAGGASKRARPCGSALIAEGLGAVVARGPEHAAAPVADLHHRVAGRGRRSGQRRPPLPRVQPPGMSVTSPATPERPPHERVGAGRGSVVRRLPAGGVVTNDDLAAAVDTTDAWIRNRVGIATAADRRAGRTVTDMAARPRQGAGGQRPDPGRHRPGHRGDLHASRPDPQRPPPRSRPGSASPPPAPST